MIEEIKMYQAVCDRCGYVCDEDEGEIEIRDTPDEMKHEAENYGWEEVNGRLLCPKCLEECCDYNPQTYEFTERIDGLDKRLNRIICECRSEAFKHLEMVDLTLKKIRNGNK